MPEYELMHQAVRAALLIGGGVGAIHYWLMCNFVTKASNWVKLAALAPSVGGGAVMFFAGVFNDLYIGMVAAPFVVCSIVAVNLSAFRAGAYVSEVLAKQHELKQARKQAYNLYRTDLTAPWENVKDLVTPSGFEAVQEAEKRAKERT